MLMSRAIVPLFLLAAVASGATLQVPSADAPLTINGLLDEDIWKQSVVLPVQGPEFGAPFPAAGEMRAVVRGGYLCLSARLPETSRVVARTTGSHPVWTESNPVWWREDLVIWTFRFDNFGTSLTVSVNPLGGYRVESTGKASVPQSVLAAASISSDAWSAEVAIPTGSLAAAGLVSVERIRAPRPDAPELRWHWPGVNDRYPFELAQATSNPPPPAVASQDWGKKPPRASAPASTDPVEEELAIVPRRAWTHADRKNPGQMWEKNLRSRVTEAALAERRDWEKVGSVADWEKFRDRRLAALKTSLGPFPERTPLRATVTRRLDYADGFILEDVLFESRPGLVVSANLYLPSKITGRIPAIVVVHSHHAPKTQSELQDLGMTWARGGTAVLIMDQLGAGERIQSQPWPKEGYYSRYALGMQLHLAGESLMKWMVWDLMRGIDLLVERPYVDPNRIVMLGAVAGGGDPAAVAAALDSRIAAVVPFNFGEASPEDHYTLGPRMYDSETADPGWGEWESTRNLRGSIAGQFFPWFLCASVAPRPFLFSFELGWPKTVEQEPMWKRYKKVFQLYGKAGNLDQIDGFGAFPGPGEVTNVGVIHRKQMYPIFKRWLDIPIPAGEYHNVRPDADLMALTPEAAAERRPKTASEIALTLAQARLDAARAARRGLPAPGQLRSLRESLKTRLGDIEPDAGAPSRALWTKSFSSFAVEAVSVDTSPGISVPLLLLRPLTGASSRSPVVLALAQGGKDAFLSERRADLASLLKRGIAVCLADVRGTGETADSDPSSLAGTELMLGNTALGARLKDARAVVRYLSARADLDPKKLIVWGDSFAAVNPGGLLLDQSVKQQPGPQTIHEADPLGSLLALLTTLYEDDVRAVATRGGLDLYLSVLRDRFCYVPLDVIVPDLLATADIPDIAAALAPRAVRIEAPVSGRNQRVTESAGDLAAWMAAQASQ